MSIAEQKVSISPYKRAVYDIHKESKIRSFSNEIWSSVQNNLILFFQ